MRFSIFPEPRRIESSSYRKAPATQTSNGLMFWPFRCPLYGLYRSASFDTPTHRNEIFSHIRIVKGLCWSRGLSGPPFSGLQRVLGSRCQSLRTGCNSKRCRLLGESLLQPPLGDLNASREPNAPVSLHVFDHFSKRGGPSRPAGNIRMELKRGERRCDRRFLIELVEKAFPQSQSVIRMVAGAVLMAVESAVAKRLAR